MTDAAKNWICDECGRRMTPRQAERAMSKGCPKRCGGLDVHEDVTPVIDLMVALKDSLAAARSSSTGETT